ncbi:hypothetical protein EHQ76_16745 [Leptospira barantonii]|uniref:Uncharacterized protein n=1 Tax=Leptospira barantonii TaxID=2023184 RepID=A0A5F2B3D7_9LEPT|nr:hypothetical protein [Leptospira barantonii]TGL95193.1 hypothetical protein EHQ76_16745 [Leptospira barantonii]
MSKKTKRWAAFFGMTGLVVALLCFTVMLSGNQCPAFGFSEQTAANDLPPCHRTEKAKEDPVPTCSSCDLLVSPESVSSKNPELDRNYFSVLSVFQNPFELGFGILTDRKGLYERNSNVNAQKFTFQSISSVRLLI